MNQICRQGPACFNGGILKRTRKVDVVTEGNSGIGLASRAAPEGEGAKVAIPWPQPKRSNEAVKAAWQRHSDSVGTSQGREMEKVYEAVRRSRQDRYSVCQRGRRQGSSGDGSDRKHIMKKSSTSFQGAYFTIQRRGTI